MDITERPDIALELLNQARATKPSRNRGWHQSDHNRCLRKSVVSAFMDRDEEADLSLGTKLRFLRGEGIHSFLSEHKPEYSFYAEGVGFCTIDRPWWDEDGVEWPMELKTTGFSSAYPPTKHANYISQLATYVVKKAIKEDGGVWPDRTYKGYLYVLHEQGDYASRQPEHRAYEFCFTGSELLDWDAELFRRHTELNRALNALKAKEETDLAFSMQAEKLKDLLPLDDQIEDMLPPITDHYDWECDQYGPCPIRELIHCPGNKSNGSWGLPFQVGNESYTRQHRVEKEKKSRG